MVEQSNDQCSSLSCLSCSTPERIELLHCALEWVREFLLIPVGGLRNENTVTNLVKMHSGLPLISLSILILICDCLNGERSCGRKFHKRIKSL